MNRTEFKQRFYYLKQPTCNFELAKEYITSQFGFECDLIEIQKSYNGIVYYPLFLDKKCNYIMFKVRSMFYSCIDGELELLGRER